MVDIPKITGDPQVDKFNKDVADTINRMDFAVGQQVTTGTDDEGRPTVGDTTLGYQERYLHVRYATNESGTAGFTNDYTTIPSSAVTGGTVYQGLRNSTSTTETTNPADYVWRLLSVSLGWIPSYRTIGGRQIDWSFVNVTPSGFLVDSGDAIDLDSLPGAVGADGNTSGYIAYFIRSATVPSVPASSTIDTTDGTVTTPPTGYTRTIPARDGNPLYIVDASFFGTGSVIINWGTPRLYVQDGSDGSDGQNARIDIAYATAADGSTGFALSPFEGATYIGQRVVTWTTTAPPVSNTASDYAWSLFRGTDGATGPVGTSSRLDIAYFNTADGTGGAFPSGTLAGGDYAAATRGSRNFQGTNVVTWSTGTEPPVSTTASDYEITQLTGDSGADGLTGLSNRVDFAYANTANGDTDFSTTYFTDALYVGTDVVSYTAGTTPPAQSTTNTDYEWSRLRGADGVDGQTGASGTSSRLDIAYFEDSSGTNGAFPSGTLGGGDYTDAVRGTRNFQGTNVITWNVTEPAVSITPGDYEITQLTGDTGATGADGTDGVDGVTGLSTRVDFAYANSADGTTGFSTTYFTDAIYIGTNAVSYTAGTTPPAVSTTASDYEWSRILGDQGPQGLSGFNTAVPLIYTRSSAEPTTAPDRQARYTFSTAELLFGTPSPAAGTLLGSNTGGYQFNTAGLLTTFVVLDGDRTGDMVFLRVSGSTNAGLPNGDYLATVALDSGSISRYNNLTDLEGNPTPSPASDISAGSGWTFQVFTIGEGPLVYTENSSNGWFNAPGLTTGTDQLWVRSASAVSREATDTIDTNEWTSPSQVGSQGIDGADGLNTATVALYQRNSSTTAPALPNQQDSYNFSTGTLGLTTNNGWQTIDNLTSTGTSLWVTTATASSRTAQDTIEASEWSTARVLAMDGATGAAGIVLPIFTRSDNIPNTRPTAQAQYRVDTGILRFNTAAEGSDPVYNGAISNGWSQDPDLATGSGVLWARTLVVYTADERSLIEADDWGNAFRYQGPDGLATFFAYADDVTVVDTTTTVTGFNLTSQPTSRFIGVVTAAGRPSDNTDYDWTQFRFPSTSTAEIFTRSASTPTSFPSTVLRIDRSAGTRFFEDPDTMGTFDQRSSNGWHLDLSNVPAGSGPIWSRRVVNDNSLDDIINIQPSGWEAPAEAIPEDAVRSVSRIVFAVRTDGSASAPTFPTDWTYNFNSQVWAGTMTNWVLTAPAVDVTGTATYWQAIISATEANPNAGTATGVFSNASRSFQFDGVVRFTSDGTGLSDGGDNNISPLSSGDNISTLTNDAGYTNTSVNGVTGNITTIDGGIIDTSTLNVADIVLRGDNSIDIETSGGSIRAGLSTFPDTLASFSGSGIWMGRDDDGLPKFIIGRQDNHLAFDGNTIQLAGRVLTDSNILSVDGDFVSTRNYRTSQDDYVDLGQGNIMGGTLTVGTDEANPGSALGTPGNNIRYTFNVNVVSDPVAAQTQGNVLLGRHYYIEINTTNDSVYSAENGNVILCIGSTDAGFTTDFYTGTFSNDFYEGSAGTTARNESAGTAPGTTFAFFFIDRESFAYPIRRTHTFDQTGLHQLTLDVLATGGVVPGWTRLALEAYATGIEEIFTINGTPGGATRNLDNNFESIQNVQITPTANVNTWYTGISAAGTSDTINIHSSSNANCSVVVRGY